MQVIQRRGGLGVKLIAFLVLLQRANLPLDFRTVICQLDILHIHARGEDRRLVIRAEHSAVAEQNALQNRLDFVQPFPSQDGQVDDKQP